MRRSTIGTIFVSAGVVMAACSFPEVFIAGDTSSSGGGTTSTTSSLSHGSGGSGGGGGSSSSTTSDTSSTSSSTTSSTSTGPCTTDDDGDKVISWVCDPNDPAKDCADEDVRAFPDAGFQAAPITGTKKAGTLPFDFNCNGAEESEIPVLNCVGLAICNSTPTGFQANVLCGAAAPLGHCVNAGLGCAWGALSPAQNVVQRCK